jgi:large subunit ribosomal protein L20
MPRVGSGTVKHERAKKVLKSAKGYRGARSTQYRTAKEAVMKAGLYAYRDRRNKKRDFRKLWISRINARSRMAGLSYSQFMNKLKKAGVILNRKQLSDIAVRDDVAFDKLVEIAKAQKK